MISWMSVYDNTVIFRRNLLPVYDATGTLQNISHPETTWESHVTCQFYMYKHRYCTLPSHAGAKYSRGHFLWPVKFIIPSHAPPLSSPPRDYGWSEVVRDSPTGQ
jgi:hypothetical protein